jgi:peptide/nickel transport system permease protein
MLKRIQALLLRSPGNIVGLLIISGVLLCAILADFVAPYDPLETNLRHRLQPPSKVHLLGTDSFGRDILSRIIYGARPSLLIGVNAVIFALLLGSAIGIVAGYFGGNYGYLLMRIVEILMCFPSILIAIAIVAVLEPGVMQLIIAIAVANVPSFARLAFASTLTIREREFVLAAEASGSSRLRIMVKHVLPNIISPLLVMGTLQLGSAIVTEAGLSFLGIGIQPPTPTWGLMLNEGKPYLRDAPWITISAGGAILLTVLGFNLVGDGLRDILDPRYKLIRGG